MASYKHDRAGELGSSEKKLQLTAVRAGLEFAACGLPVRRPNHSGTLPSEVKLTTKNVFFMQFYQKRVRILETVAVFVFFIDRLRTTLTSCTSNNGYFKSVL